MSDGLAPRFELPVWVIEEIEEAQRSWFPRSVCHAGVSGKTALPLFSDEHLAARYIEDCDANVKPRRPYCIDTPAALDILLHYFLARGVHVVAFDVPHQSRPHERGWSFDLPGLINTVFANF